MKNEYICRPNRQTTHKMLDETLKWMARVALADGYFSPEEVKVIEQYAQLHGIDSEPVIEALHEAAAKLDPTVIPLHRNVVRGIEFENAVARRLSAMPGITIESRSADFKMNDWEIADERSLLPDFLIQHKLGRFTLRYWLECKYRSTLNNVYFQDYQVDRYAKAQHRDMIPAFIMLGSGGTPMSPDHFFLIPVDDITKLRCAYKDGCCYNFTRKGLSRLEIDIDRFDTELRKHLDI